MGYDHYQRAERKLMDNDFGWNGHDLFVMETNDRLEIGFVFAFVSTNYMGVVGDPFITPLVCLTPFRIVPIRDKMAFRIYNTFPYAIVKVRSIIIRQIGSMRWNTQRLGPPRFQQFEHRQ